MLKQQHLDLFPSSHSTQARVLEPIANGWKSDWPENQPLQGTSRIDVQLTDARRYALPTI